MLKTAAAVIVRVLPMTNHARPMVQLRNFIPSWPCLSFEWHFYFVPSCSLFLLCAGCVLSATLAVILLRNGQNASGTA